MDTRQELKKIQSINNATKEILTKEGNGRRRALKVVAGIVVIAVAGAIVGILRIFPTGQEPTSTTPNAREHLAGGST